MCRGGEGDVESKKGSHIQAQHFAQKGIVKFIKSPSSCLLVLKEERAVIAEKCALFITGLVRLFVRS